MKKNSKVMKGLTLFLILVLIGINILPICNGNSYDNKSNKNNEKIVWSQDNPSGQWTQIIGDFPNGEMNNGFNNSYNVAVRGKAIFTIDNEEYLFLGTGNVISSPHTPEITNLLQYKLVKSGFLFLKQLILNIVVRAMENYFSNVNTQGCDLWYYDGVNWEQSVGNDSENATIDTGFGNSNNMELTMLIPYKPISENKTYLYAGTFNPRDGLEIWRNDNPIKGPWEPLIHQDGEGDLSSGFGNPNNHAAYSAAILNDWLYIGTMNWREGCEIWRTDGDIWQKIIGEGCSISNGFGDDNIGFERDIYAWEMLVYEDTFSNQSHLYVGTFNIAGCEFWRTSDGENWTCLIGDEGILRRGFNMFGTPIRTHNYGIRRIEVFKGALYLGTASVPPFGVKTNGKNRILSNVFLESIGSGCSIWRFDGLSFEKIIGRKLSRDINKHSGFGDWTNAYIWSFREFDGRLFAGTWNPGRFLTDINFQLSYPILNISLITDESQHTNSAGCEIWYTDDGINWHQMVGDEVHNTDSEWPENGFGDNNNIGARALISYKGNLYLGITNTVDGCELWRFDGSSYPNHKI